MTAMKSVAIGVGLSALVRLSSLSLAFEGTRKGYSVPGGLKMLRNDLFRHRCVR